MGQPFCSIVTVNKNAELEQPEEQEIFDQFVESPHKKFNDLLKSKAYGKFFPMHTPSILSFTTNEERNIDEHLNAESKNFFKYQTGGISTDSLYIEGDDEGSELFQVQESDSELSLNLTPNLSSFQPLKKKIEQYVKEQKINVNEFYKAETLLGKGGRVKIYEARNKLTGKKRALKLITNEEKLTNGEKKVIKETQIMSKLDHPNIIKVIEIFNWERNNCIVMELCEGPNLFFLQDSDEIMKMSSSGKKHLIKVIFRQILKALNYMKEKGIIYRNLHAKNILLLRKDIFPIENNLVKLLNFGKAFQTNNDDIKVRRSKPYQPSSISPQQSVQKAYFIETDIWYAGILLFYFLTGKQAFEEGEEESESGCFQKNLQAWCLLEAEEKQLLKGMLQIDRMKRFSPIQCLDSQWLCDTEAPQYFDNRQRLSKIVDKKKEKRKSNLFSHIEALAVFKNIPQEQIQEITKLFQKLDVDNSGTVQLNEVIALLQAQSKISNNIEEAIEIIKRMDIDGSGSIDYHEFLTGLCAKKKIFKKNIIQDIFKHFDTDNDGVIDEEQFRKEMEGMPNQQLEYYLSKLQQGEKKKITKEDFIKYSLNKYDDYYDQKQKISQESQ